MKNWTIERFMAKGRDTETLDDPGYYLKQLAKLLVFPIYESDGQFTSGYSSDRYVYEGMVYEFDYYENKLVSGTMYSEEYL